MNHHDQGVFNLRSLLRRATRQEHHRVDDLFSQLDLTNRQDYRHFLTAHRVALAALVRDIPTDDAFCPFLDTAVAELDADCRRCRAEAGKVLSPNAGEALHPLGVGYVVAGSHFGKRVLTRRWSRSEDVVVRSAGRYLTGETCRQMWSVFLDRVNMEPHGLAVHQDVIVKSAKAAFRVFEGSFRMTGENREQPAA